MRGRANVSVPNASHWQRGEAAVVVDESGRVRSDLARAPKRWRQRQDRTTPRSASFESRDCGLNEFFTKPTGGRHQSGVTKVMNIVQTKRMQGGRNGAASKINGSQFPTSGLTRRRSDASANPQESFERYVTLARAAAASGDTIETERHFQHAEHYFRLMNKNTA